MTKPAYTQADWDAVSDNPELTAADFARAVPFDQAFPDLAKSIKRRGQQRAPTKQSITIRLSPDVLAYFRATGDGWQSRIDRALKEWVAGRG